MNNKQISIFVNASPLSNKYLPMLLNMGDTLCRFYGQGQSRGVKLPKELQGKVTTTGIVMKIFRCFLLRVLMLFRLPLYYEYWINVKILDFFYAKRIARDNSQIVFISTLFKNAIKKARDQGKYIVVEAGNSEPNREHERIKAEYDRYCIRHKYIYGDSRFRDTCIESLNNADKIITISKVSRQTYIDAGFLSNKLVLVPLTGTDFPVQPSGSYIGKKKAFISTAYHNFIKGTHRLLLAWKQAEINNIPLIIVGRICEDLEEFIAKYGPFNNVYFVGLVANLSQWYKDYDAVGVLLSFSEGAGRVTPEMMAFGFPMIVSPDATCDLVIDGHNGYVIEPTDVEGISSRIKWFAEDWERVHGMQKNVVSSVFKRTTKDWSLDVVSILLENSRN